MTLTSVLLALDSKGNSRNIVQNPSLAQFQSATSVHVLGFTSRGELLVAESEGSFTMEDWDEVFETGKALCCGGEDAIDDEAMGGVALDEKGDMSMFVKSVLEHKIEKDLHWKD